MAKPLFLTFWKLFVILRTDLNTKDYPKHKAGPQHHNQAKTL